MFLVVLPIRLCVLIIDLVKRLHCTEEKMQLINLSNQFSTNTTIGEKYLRNSSVRLLIPCTIVSYNALIDFIGH